MPLAPKCTTCACGSQRVAAGRRGQVAERLNAPVLKTGVGASPPWVRIPPCPPKPRDPCVRPLRLHFIEFRCCQSRWRRTGAAHPAHRQRPDILPWWEARRTAVESRVLRMCSAQGMALHRLPRDEFLPPNRFPARRSGTDLFVSSRPQSPRSRFPVTVKAASRRSATHVMPTPQSCNFPA